MKKFKVIQFRFNNGKIRVVEVPTKTDDIDIILNDIFKYGQNDVQPVKGSPSVSVGDVILIGTDKYVVKPVGFEKLTEELFGIFQETSNESDNSSIQTSYRNLLWQKLGEKSFDYC